MPKKKDDTKIKPEPSKPIEQKDKDKKEKENQKLKEAKKLEDVLISTNGSITAGTWVAEIDSTNVRKNRLRDAV